MGERLNQRQPKGRDHGGDVFAAAAELGIPPGAILDFSASINPLGAPPEVLQAARGALEVCGHYPEIDASSLQRDLASFHQLPAESLLPGAGSTELVFLLPRVLRPSSALLVTPAFSEYRPALTQVGCSIENFPVRPGEDIDIARLIAAVRNGVDLLLLANPGNPHGGGLKRETVLRIVADCRGVCQIVVDEAFVDFAPDLSVIDRVAEEDHLWVLRSMTKFYAIPGLRVGYLAGPLQGMAALRDAKEPWRLSTPAIAAARACLAAGDYRDETLAAIAAWRAELVAGLEGLGCQVFPSVANYLLFRLPNVAPSAAQLSSALRRRAILVRDCSNFEGLTERFMRVAVRTREENSRLLTVMEDLIG